jgi:hypothetical protein
MKIVAAVNRRIARVICFIPVVAPAPSYQKNAAAANHSFAYG